MWGRSAGDCSSEAPNEKNGADTRDTIKIIDTRGTIDVLDAFDLRDWTSLWTLLGAAVPASHPDTFALLLPALTV